VEWTVDARADSYLDGSLLPDEVIAFEHELAEKPEVASALRSAIALRQLLRALPPVEPPAGLEERIAASLFLNTRAESQIGRALLPRARAALAGASWLIRWPAATLSSQREGARAATSGLAQCRWMLGPLSTVRGAPRRARTPAPTPIWKRALAFARA
jgi:anti-sigma factor RsiW